MQNSRLQLTEATVWDQMIWPFRKAWRKPVSSALVSRAEELLVQWHLEDYRAAQPWELSGGMQRRLALASMEMLSPQIYLLDEPLEGLDVEHRLLFATKIAEWSTTVPVVVCSHSWRWLLLHTEWGWWCDNGLTWGRMGDLWYRYGNIPGSPLEELWRQLLDAGAPVAPEAWIQSDRARKEVTRLWNSRPEIPSTH